MFNNLEISQSFQIKYYSTKFEPPKKQPKRNPALAVNVKKFLERKEAEEREKAELAKKKRDELLALRSQDKKATRRVNVMLKRTKSANQSAIEDAIDKDNTAVTLAGPYQPDEDDYGYVSQEAANFYNKMMEKYSKMPDEPKFSLEKKKVNTNLNSIKARTIAALENEKAEHGHRKRRKRTDEENIDDGDMEREKDKAKKPKIAPPPMNFAGMFYRDYFKRLLIINLLFLCFLELLKIAEKKQYEPIVIEPKSTKDDERPLTKKQKKELEREKEWRDRREGKLPPITPTPPPKTQKPPPSQKPPTKPVSAEQPKPQMKQEKPKLPTKPQLPSKPEVPNKNANKVPQRMQEKKPSLMKPQKPSNPVAQKPSPNNFKVPSVKQHTNVQKPPPPKFPPNDLKMRDGGPKPSDVKKKGMPMVKRKPMVVKGKFLDDDDEDYDSEMDDFIDDGPEEGEDYSKYISEIFGYDKSKYRSIEDDVDNMESSFSQQMKEEFISTKIGIMEDLEDMKKEEEEKRRKALMKKRKL